MQATVPGVVIDHVPASAGLYIGSPSLAILPDGSYAASHDLFGPRSGEHVRARSLVFGSADRGRTWERLAEISGAFWSSLFVHRGDLYLLGTDRHHGNIVVRRSQDGGRTWTEPTDGKSGLIRDNGEYHCAPTPVTEHRGRLWRAFEWRNPPNAWGVHYRSGVLSVPVGADLLDADNWTETPFLASDRAWNGGDMGGWLEGNVLVAPDGSLVNLLRVETKSLPERAALIRMDAEGMRCSFDPESGFVEMPGGAKKFTVRYDPASRLYWSLTNAIQSPLHGAPPASVRNTLALIRSSNLRRWTVHRTLLRHPDVRHHAFQYADWHFEGEDIIAVCRTAWDDAFGGAANYHDANYLTFHRFADFRG